MRFGLFRRDDRPKPRSEAGMRVKGWLLAALDLAPEATDTVNEIVCLDPSCPGTETVMLVAERGKKTRAYKVSKPIEAVTEQDVREALF